MPETVMFTATQSVRLAQALTTTPAPTPQPAPVSFQQNWRCCQQCHGLVYAGSADAGACSGGGKHVTGASAGYALQCGDGDPGMQPTWRWCEKCQGLVYAGFAPGNCPAGGTHDTHRSIHYAVTVGDGGQGRQAGWRWCRKCMALTLTKAGGDGGACPAGGQHDTSGSAAYAMTIDSLPVAPVMGLKPQLFLVETYQLSSFRGGLLRDELVATMQPMLPHQDMTCKVVTRVRTTAEEKQTSTVLDQQSTESAENFNKQVKQSADSKFAGEHYDYGMQANFHGEGSVGFGSATADAHLDVNGSTNDVRNELANSVASALDTQVSQANQARRDTVHVTSSDSSIDRATETETIVHTTNPTDAVENFGIYQLKQEHVSILSLVDMEVAFMNTAPDATQTVPLFRLDALLNQVIDRPEERGVVKAQIRDCLSKIRNVDDEAQSIIVDDPAQPGGFIVNKRLQSRYQLRNADGSVRQIFAVPGVILRAWTKQLKKPSASVVALIQ
jgi:hypothetical protein